MSTGSYRDHLAAFSTSTGALISWAPAATRSKVDPSRPLPSGSPIYVGGDFPMLDGQPARTRARSTPRRR